MSLCLFHHYYCCHYGPMCKVLLWNLKPFWNKAVKWQRNCNMMWKKWSAANTFWCTVVLLSTRWCCSVCNVAAVLYSYLSSYLWESEDVPATCTEQVKSTRGKIQHTWAEHRCVHSITLGSWTPLTVVFFQITWTNWKHYSFHKTIMFNNHYHGICTLQKLLLDRS